MSQADKPFREVYREWLESFWVLIPGGAPAGPCEEVVRKEEQVEANQEWEHEGGSVKPVPVPEVKDAPKIPF